MRPLSPEQLLAIADEYCEVARVRVKSFPSLCAAAAVPGARVHGVPVFDSAPAAAAALAATVSKLQPLTGANAGFAEVVRRVYLDWVEQH
ncbi:TetR family transcriptional regulator [Corynebacterium sanguinis]|uniref:TetR family transcriptional regulator n=1 Tax=Corynebacterium sanguinis TaxID=2594913 RepID=UPI00223B924B|nr:TetR family transcriptional regulator [Corynebacterium sanguinis]MCT1585611.1 TetR family transcriptional regulator [Corynebacterium sanguinis]MCT2024192.1 TetR family transcriptional regulator [Corynebacterium sanguinis]MCT2047893.1 TetR family transcriptional regulator [Corynebacterium sanguinis]MCT2155189.1 TetR family transcriptional regulator [Corynebacterium sanguinis]MDN8577030.1 TetR family transcriptional regulator [Corynebacterium sanguinis]